jgi:hypothetical protein
MEYHIKVYHTSLVLFVHVNAGGNLASFIFDTKGTSKATYRRRVDNTMAEMK